MPNDPQTEERADGSESPEPPKKLDKNQKLAAASLGVFAFLVVLLWFVQLKNNIYAPLNSGTAGLSETSQIDDQTASDLALKNKDTDADSLSDYDELNLYKTSPYLDDSDSDGLKDGAEIRGGTDPNCPQGRTCASSGSLDISASDSAPAAGQNKTLEEIMGQYNEVNQLAPAAGGSGAADLNSEQINILKNIDAASLREMLIEAGMEKEALDQISDQELMASYAETLEGQAEE